MADRKWLKWENGAEYMAIPSPVLDEAGMLMTYCLKGRVCHDVYSAPFAEDGQVYYCRYDPLGECWGQDRYWLGPYTEDTVYRFRE